MWYTCMCIKLNSFQNQDWKKPNKPNSWLSGPSSLPDQDQLYKSGGLFVYFYKSDFCLHLDDEDATTYSSTNANTWK